MLHTILRNNDCVKRPSAWLFAFLVATFVVVPSAAAQIVRGTVSSGATNTPVSGAVVMGLDSAGGVVGRSLTNERGEFAFSLRASAAQMRVQRIGFRMATLPSPKPVDGVMRLDVTLAPIPAFLNPVRVLAQAQCSKRSDRSAAFDLLEQARAGLLATVVARESNPAELVRLTYSRTMAGNSDEILRQTIDMGVGDRLAKSFTTAYNAADFVRRGFADDLPDGVMYYAPDADVLLDDAFSSGYCFHIANAEKTRPNQIGLAFRPANKRDGRMDIDGVLWIDTVARALSDIEFLYLGVARPMSDANPGGKITFRDMGNGVVMVARWNLRIVDVQAVRTVLRTGRTPMATMEVREIGGEVAHAKWPDGHTWDAPLGKLRVNVKMEDESSAEGRELWLKDSPYFGAVDKSGVVEFVDLLPGPYSAELVEPRFAELHLTLPTTVQFTAVRDSTVVQSMRGMTAESFVRKRCIADGRMRPGADFMMFGRVSTQADSSIADAWIEVLDKEKPFGFAYLPSPSSAWIARGYPFKTGSDGLFQVCAPPPPEGSGFQTRIRHPNFETVVHLGEVTGKLQILKIQMQPPH